MALGPQISSSDCMGTSVLFARGVSLGILEVFSPPIQQSLSMPALLIVYNAQFINRQTNYCETNSPSHSAFTIYWLKLVKGYLGKYTRLVTL